MRQAIATLALLVILIGCGGPDLLPPADYKKVEVIPFPSPQEATAIWSCRLSLEHQTIEMLYPGLNKNAALPFSAFQQAFGYCAGMPQLALQLISQVLCEKDSPG